MKNALSFILFFMLFVSFTAKADYVSELIDNMGQNEATLMNAPNTDWAKHGYLDMGFSTRGDATPSYWANAQGSRFTSSEPWTAILPWFHLWPAEGNSGVSRAKVGNIKVQVLIDGQWRTLNLNDNQWAQLEPWTLIGGKGGVNKRDEGNGYFSYEIDNSGPVHGGLGKFDLWDLGVNPAKISGVAISAEAEVIEGDGVILFEIGGDYYPNTSVSVERDYELGWGPAIGGSKFAIIDGVKCLTMVTIDPPGVGDKSKFEKAGGKVALTHDELRNNPPKNLCSNADDNNGGGSGGGNNSGGSGNTGGGGNSGGSNGGGGSNVVNGHAVITVSKSIIRQIERLIDLYEGKQSDKIPGDAVIQDAEIVIDKLEYLIDIYE